MPKLQIASVIYLEQLNTVKKILDLLQLKFGKESEEFQYLKKQLFDFLYSDIKKLFMKLEIEKLIKRCPQGCSLRQGWTKCESCNGSGYTNF